MNDQKQILYKKNREDERLIRNSDMINAELERILGRKNAKRRRVP